MKSKRIDSLLAEVDTVAQQINQANVDSLNYFHTKTELLWKEMMQDDFEGLSDQERLKHNRIANIMKISKRLIERYTNFQKELAYTEHQLSTLKEDLQSQTIADSLFQKYFEEENRLFFELKHNVARNLDMLDKEIEYYNKVIQEYIDYQNNDSTKQSVSNLL